MSNTILFPAGAELRLRLSVGGNFPYKWQIYEYNGANTPEPLDNGSDGRGEGSTIATASKIEQGVQRRFVWSVAVVSNDDPIEVDVTGQVLDGKRLVGEVKGPITIKKPFTNCFVHLWVEGIP
ncbi:MAG TPA: hypothetical protein VN253_05705 [Kofleriaceae bacterium]|nr:hypothetical protein [Kofleriaceae bacterium]